MKNQSERVMDIISVLMFLGMSVGSTLFIVHSLTMELYYSITSSFAQSFLGGVFAVLGIPTSLLYVASVLGIIGLSALSYIFYNKFRQLISEE